MMQQYSILNSREVKHIKETLVKQFGTAPQEDYAYLKTTKDKLFIINKDLGKLELKNLIVDKVGLYFGEIMDNGEVRLSKEGAQLVVREASGPLKNGVQLSEKEVKVYFAGIDLERDLGEENKMVLLRYEEDVLGCAKYKEGKILNFLPKIHRGE